MSSQDNAPSEPTGADPSRDDSESSATTWPTRLRRVCAGIAAVAGGVLAIASYWVKDLKVCRPVSVGTVIAQACGPWGYLEIAPFVLIAAVLTVPDLSELNVASLISLKREVKSQKREIEATATKQGALEGLLNAQLLNLQNAQSNNIFFGDAKEAFSQLSKVGQKFEESVGVAPSGEPAISDAPTSHGDREIPGARYGDGAANGHHSRGEEDESERLSPSEEAELKFAIIETWESLSPYTKATPRGYSVMRELTAEQRDKVIRWNTVFRDEIDTLRAIRNSVAHARPVKRSDLLVAAQAGAALQRYLNEALE